jgi:deoxyhypusine synthase
MLKWRLKDDPIKPNEQGHWLEPNVRAKTRCTVWLSFTSNMISSGIREFICYLVQHKMVSAIVTTAGAVEEDIMKTLRPHYMGDFHLRGHDLRMRGLNRLGNLIVPNKNYEALEEWFVPLLNKMHDEQDNASARRIWSPSQLIARMGETIQDETSVWYWAAKNKIPVFCPGLTDGAIGDMIFFHSWEREGFILDIASDVRRINRIAMRAKRSAMIILGGGVAKHHTCNANLMRNGADHAIFINTAQEFDGSDSGARPDEAVSWGKIRLTASPVKIYSDATLVFPILVAQTWAKIHAQVLAALNGTDPTAMEEANDRILNGYAEPAEEADEAAQYGVKA